MQVPYVRLRHVRQRLCRRPAIFFHPAYSFDMTQPTDATTTHFSLYPLQLTHLENQDLQSALLLDMFQQLADLSAVRVQDMESMITSAFSCYAKHMPDQASKAIDCLGYVFALMRIVSGNSEVIHMQYQYWEQVYESYDEVHLRLRQDRPQA